MQDERTWHQATAHLKALPACVGRFIGKSIFGKLLKFVVGFPLIWQVST